MTQKKIRVLVVDDSKYMRFVLSKILNEDPGIEVVGESHNGLDALQKVRELKPDVVTLDVEMPRMNGLEALKNILEQQPTPVIMVSNYTQQGGEITIRALELGAIDFVQKPEGRESLTMSSIKKELLAKVRLAANIKPASSDVLIEPAPAIEKKPGKIEKMKKVVVIGSSTGGPRALAAVLSCIPPDAPIGILVVQHMPAGFTSSLAKRLNQLSRIAVSEAAEGDLVAQGRAFIAPGGFHMKISKMGKMSLSTDPAVNGVRPAIDVTMADVAEVYGDKVIGVILTGMGNDGTAGGAAIRKKGGVMIAQLGSSCVVDGMPSSLIKAGQADRIAPLDSISREILSLI
jgi:two-component system, chemotaxis family, protein-glutamate methylesterase/glutaminase